jgi:ATP-binding cassette subfamily B protein
LRGAASVRPLGVSDYLLGRLFKASREAILASRRFGPLVVIPFSVIFLILALNEAIGLLIGVRLVERGLFTVGSIYLIIEYNALIGQPLRELAWQLGRFQSAGACVSRVCELLEREVEFVESPLVDGELPKGALGLRLRDLRISYGDGKAVLAGLSLNLEQGRSLGVIGRTGGGKTSLARSLVRLYPLSGGSIELFQGDSSFDLNKIPLPELRCRVALVSQEVQVFSASVRDNLTLFGALPNADDERLSWALGEVGMGEWLRGLPLGLDTELLAEGKDLSAGESQLLALARVFLRDPGLIVLDEASSKIDPSSQARLDGAVARLCEGRTAILIAHRLSTLKDVNDILVLGDGGIAEYGGRAELAARQSSLYSRLLRSGSGEGALYTDAEGEEGA